MSSYHLSVKSGKKGTAASHAAYIAREGKYARNGKQFDLVAKEYGNLPEFSSDEPQGFWKAADRYERINGAAYRELVVALPAELTIEQNIALTHELIQKEIGNKSYQLAIHAPIAAIGGVPQMHAHIMYSDRLPDEFDRLPQQHFKRYNPAHPEQGGCRKDSGGKPAQLLREELVAKRKLWADLQNAALAKHGHAARVDHRSLEAQGIERAPERHIGPGAIRYMTEEDKARLVQARTTQAHAKPSNTHDTCVLY